MNKRVKQRLWVAIALAALFIGYTALVANVDVKRIGPKFSEVGFASMNSWFRGLTGLNLDLYNMTDIISVLPFIVVGIFAVVGIVQWVRRRSIFKVDADIKALGVFYVLVFGAYALFEVIKINYRPVLIDGVLETSYPSSTTMLAITVLGTAMMLAPKYLEGWKSRAAVAFLGVLLGFMVVVRLLSGVHWLSDIIGGILLSAALMAVYEFIRLVWAEHDEKRARRRGC